MSEQESTNPNENQPPAAATIIPEVDLSDMLLPQLRELAVSKYGLVLKGNVSKARLLEQIAEATTGSKYVVLIRTLHDGEYYEVGDEIELTEKHALQLLAAKAIGVSV